MTTQPLKLDGVHPPAAIELSGFGTARGRGAMELPESATARGPAGHRGRPFLERLADLASLAVARLGWVRRRGADSASFDVTSARDPGPREAASALLDQFSWLAGQTHALSDDPWQFLWARDRRAFLPFQELVFTLIAWRGPVGHAEAGADLIERFRSYAARRGKHAVVLGVSRSDVEGLSARRFQSMWIGTEPFYDLATWHTRGKAGMKVRLACNHVRRLGAVAREAHPLRDARDRDAIETVADAWRSARPQRRINSFLRLSPFENARHRRYFVVETKGRMESFLVCSPVSRRGQYLQDLVRMPDAPRGANELAILTALSAFQDEGLEFVTGGIVPFFDPSKPCRGRAAGGAGARGWTVRHFDRLFRFAGLQQFRAKFAPSRLIDIYVLLWPGILTPTLVWEIRSALA
jgi:lysylphosphatidylglycerol synthetase-like protein (DUF2156 family)